MILTKVSHDVFNNGQKDLETKTFLKHDLVHFAIDQALGLYDAENPTDHSPEIEQIAGIMHSIFDAEIPNARFKEGTDNLFSAYDRKSPAYFTDEFIDSVRTTSLALLKQYDLLKTGESMELLLK